MTEGSIQTQHLPTEEAAMHIRQGGFPISGNEGLPKVPYFSNGRHDESHHIFLDLADNEIVSKVALYAPDGSTLPPSHELARPTISVPESHERRRGKRRLIVAANRFPMNFERNEDGTLKKDIHGKFVSKPSIGGLVTALKPVMASGDTEGMYVGWTGSHDPELAGFEETGAVDPDGNKTHFVGVFLKKSLEDAYYNGFSNSHLWMKYHPGLAQYAESGDETYWEAYKEVNKRFADKIMKKSHPDDVIFIQDYHLQLLARDLRNMGLDNPMAFFLHIPFPDLNTFATVDHHIEILDGLLANDSIGFQSIVDRDNFIEAVRAFGSTVAIKDTEEGTIVTVVEKRGEKIIERNVLINAFPISIDSDEFEEQARHPAVAQAEALINPGKPEDFHTFYGGSRIDPSKAPLLMMTAHRRALEKDKSLHGLYDYRRRYTPSRMSVAVYKYMHEEVQKMATETNRLYGTDNWTPVNVMTNEANRYQTIAEYRRAKAIDAGSLSDGMNLTGLEAAIVNDSDELVVMAGERTGIKHFLGENAVSINPEDTEATADAMITIVTMPKAKRAARARGARELVHRHTVFDWGRDNVGGAIRMHTAQLAS